MSKLLKDASLEDMRVELNKRLNKSINNPPSAFLGVFMTTSFGEMDKLEQYKAIEDINIDIPNIANDIQPEGEAIISKRMDAIVSVCDDLGFSDLQILN